MTVFFKIKNVGSEFEMWVYKLLSAIFVNSVDRSAACYLCIYIYICLIRSISRGKLKRFSMKSRKNEPF